MNKFIGFIFVTLFVFFFSFSVMAEDGSSWISDKKQLEKIWSENVDDNKKCQATWNLLWSWSKKENLEARATLFRLVFPAWPDFPQIFMPGRFEDEISTRRDALILAIHSSGVQYDDKKQQEAYEDYSDLLYASFLAGWPRGDSFLSCLKTESKEYCAKYAALPGATTQTKLVPDFNEYAAEIDALTAQGMKPHCINFCKGTWKQPCNANGDEK